MRNMSVQIMVDNIRLGECCDDTGILCNSFPYLRTRSQFLLIKKWSSGSRTASSVRVRCKQFRMNKMLPQSVRYCEYEVKPLPTLRTRSILNLYQLFSTITRIHALSLTITEQYTREGRACDCRQIVSSELVPRNRQCNCVRYDERAPGDDRDFT